MRCTPVISGAQSLHANPSAGPGKNAQKVEGACACLAKGRCVRAARPSPHTAACACALSLPMARSQRAPAAHPGAPGRCDLALALPSPSVQAACGTATSLGRYGGTFQVAWWHTLSTTGSARAIARSRSWPDAHSSVIVPCIHAVDTIGQCPQALFGACMAADMLHCPFVQ